VRFSGEGAAAPKEIHMATTRPWLALLLAAPQVVGASPGFAGAVRLGTPIERGNLSVFPLKLRTASPAASTPAADLATLDGAVARKELSIHESGASGSVNALDVENRGDRPVLLLAGELLLGGKQDRIIGRSLVLAPRSRTRVPVFCVEQGRWSGAKGFESGGSMGHAELRKKVLAGDQAKVWAEVARSNARLGTKNASDTYRAAARKLGDEVGQLAKEIAGALARDREVAGIAVAVDREVIAIEWFASPRIFERVREKLVSSYVAQALESRASSGSSAPAAAAPRPEAVADFAAKAERGEGLVERVPAGAAAAPLQTTYLAR
jgi:hypothetical protein